MLCPYLGHDAGFRIGPVKGSPKTAPAEGAGIPGKPGASFFCYHLKAEPELIRGSPKAEIADLVGGHQVDGGRAKQPVPVIYPAILQHLQKNSIIISGRT